MTKTRHRKTRVAGFVVHTLENSHVSVSLVPALGGKVVSLRDGVGGREWLDGWQPPRERRLWAPADARDFSTGTGAGIDECLPSVVECDCFGRRAPDHGELWARPAECRIEKAGTALACRWRLECLPLEFRRSISLKDRTVRFAYSLTNLAGEPTPYLWAWHALFSLKRGDSLSFADRVTSCLRLDGTQAGWPETSPGSDVTAANLDGETEPGLKIFVGPLQRGFATLRARRGDALELRWTVRVHPFVGIWITRGYWKDLHHWAVEPTNAPRDGLDQAAAGRGAQVWLAPGETRNWTVAATVLSPKHIRRNLGRRPSGPESP